MKDEFERAGVDKMPAAPLARSDASSALVKYDAACRAVAEAKSVDEVRGKILPLAEGMRAYARQAKNKQLEVDAAEIRIRAERRLGELIAAQRETVGLNQGAIPGKTGTKAEPVLDPRPTLAEAGIDKKLSSRAQKIAAVPDAEFEEMVGDWRERVEQENERVTVNLINRGSVVQRYTGEDEWYTPEKYIESARVCLGGIDLDPASNEVANRIVKASRFYSQDDDGLSQEWQGRVFLNPPYKQPMVADFTRRLVDEYINGNVSAAILLTNNSTDTKWWHYCAGHATAACFTLGRISFYRDREYNAPTNGQVFLYFGDSPGIFYQEFSGYGWLGVPASG